MNRSTIVRLQSQPSGRGAGCGALHFDGIENGGSLEFGDIQTESLCLKNDAELADIQSSPGGLAARSDTV